MAALKSAVWWGAASWWALCSLPAATPAPACPGSLTRFPRAQALGEPLYRVSTGNYEYRLILRCRQEARARFSQMRKDVLEKMELLDQKHGEGLRAALGLGPARCHPPPHFREVQHSPELPGTARGRPALSQT